MAEQFTSPPLEGMYTELGKQTLAHRGLQAPWEPSALGASWRAVRALDAKARGLTVSEAIAEMGTSVAEDYLTTMRRWLGVRTNAASVDRALRIGLLVVPAYAGERPPLEPAQRRVLDGIVADERDPNIAKRLEGTALKASISSVKSILSSLFDVSGLTVHEREPLIRWAHYVGHCQPLRRHQDAEQYYSDMSRFSRARQFIQLIYPNEDTHTIPNDVIYEMARSVPAALRGQQKSVRAIEAEKTYSLELQGWLMHEDAALQLWAMINGRKVSPMARRRSHVAGMARDKLSLARLRSRAEWRLAGTRARTGEH